jgi:hypothetical protein
MRRAPPLFLVLAITAAAFPGASMASPPAPIRAAQSLCAPAMALGANLIANGDAEGQAGATDAATVIAPLCWTARQRGAAGIGIGCAQPIPIPAAPL